MSMHIASLVKIPCYLLKLSSRNENMGVSRADNSLIFDEICPLAFPNQISLMSIYIASFVKILVIYLSYCPETKIWTYLGQITP